MHRAPPAVSYPMPRSEIEAALLGLTGFVGCVVQVLWMMASPRVGLPHLGGLLVCMAAVGLAAWQWRSSFVGTLNWNGTAWHWKVQETTALVNPEIIFDLQHVVLLRLRIVQGNSIWVWSQKNAAPQHWLALRRALFNQSHAVVLNTRQLP